MSEVSLQKKLIFSESSQSKFNVCMGCVSLCAGKQEQCGSKFSVMLSTYLHCVHDEMCKSYPVQFCGVEVRRPSQRRVRCSLSSREIAARSDYTGLQKKFPGLNFQYSVSFFPTEYEYESHFFPSRPDFPEFYDKGLKINKIGCLQVVFMLKLTNKLNVLHT